MLSGFHIVLLTLRVEHPQLDTSERSMTCCPDRIFTILSRPPDPIFYPTTPSRATLNKTPYTIPPKVQMSPASDQRWVITEEKTHGTRAIRRTVQSLRTRPLRERDREHPPRHSRTPRPQSVPLGRDRAERIRTDRAVPRHGRAAVLAQRLLNRIPNHLAFLGR